MRARIFAILLLMGVAVLQPRLALAEESPTLSQRWEHFTAVVKQTVSDLWNKFVGASDSQNHSVAEAPAAPVQAVPPAQTPAGQQAPAGQAPAAQQQTAAPGGQTPVAQPQGQESAGQIPVPGTQSGQMQIKKVSDSALSSSPSGSAAAVSPAQQLKQLRQSLKSQAAFTLKTPGRKHAANMKTAKKTGVPVYDFHRLVKVRSIPLLDVGEEPEISRENLMLPDFNWHVQPVKDMKRLPSKPELSAKETLSIATMVAKAGPVKVSPADKIVIDGKITHEKIQNINYQITDAANVEIKPFQMMNEDQVKMLVTKILFDRGGKCPVVVGLADELSVKPEFRSEALFELGSCAKELKLNQVAFDKLSELIKKQDPEFGSRAIAVLGKDLPILYEQPFYEIVKGVEGKPEYFAGAKVKNEIFYRTAKGAFRAGHYKAAEKWATKVDPASGFGPPAQYVTGISQYGAKEKPQARATLEKLAQSLQNSGDNILKGLVNVDLARMDFTARKFDQALPLYLKVPKDHPLWVNALIEQGWTQLAVDDFAGAIGNMYSLHSPYFKVLYQPQSFVVRTIGYLNICQFGDAYRTLSKLESDYRDWQNRLAAYMSNGRNPSSVYETVKTYLRSKSNTDVEGLPYQIVREAARGKTFLTLQNAINDKTDELGLFAGVNAKINKEKDNVRARAVQAKKRADQLALKLAAAKTSRAPADQLSELRKNMENERSGSVPNRFELAILEQSQKAFGRFQKTASAKVSESEHRLHAEAAQTLYDRLKAMQAEMSRTLDNNEFLRYEIFSGSGENIRYQVAGGQVGGENRLPASVKPQKMMNWTFDGEFWEDEIGNYRSSLKNNCPKTGTATRTDQARGE